ncbi:hypothetical protein P1X15_19120 [Runella sp. MFBS21]|uniref:hypothetical protein n=1 Tax=Runella sp. MFBS21 TaxID=3034018 RepID=UPI0023F6941B|nr:hypothetical protein [Runella sp. MFBS21]MDF7819740.1 hypothetical protein [Runella sp. MFBS21]
MRKKNTFHSPYHMGMLAKLLDLAIVVDHPYVVPTGSQQAAWFAQHFGANGKIPYENVPRVGSLKKAYRKMRSIPSECRFNNATLDTFCRMLEVSVDFFECKDFESFKKWAVIPSETSEAKLVEMAQNKVKEDYEKRKAQQSLERPVAASNQSLGMVMQEIHELLLSDNTTEIVPTGQFEALYELDDLLQSLPDQVIVHSFIDSFSTILLDTLSGETLKRTLLKWIQTHDLSKQNARISQLLIELNSNLKKAKILGNGITNQLLDGGVHS